MLELVTKGHQQHIPLYKPLDGLVTHGENSHLTGTAHEQGDLFPGERRKGERSKPSPQRHQKPRGRTSGPASSSPSTQTLSESNRKSVENCSLKSTRPLGPTQTAVSSTTRCGFRRSFHRDFLAQGAWIPGRCGEDGEDGPLPLQLRPWPRPRPWPSA